MVEYSFEHPANSDFPAYEASLRIYLWCVESAEHVGCTRVILTESLRIATGLMPQKNSRDDKASLTKLDLLSERDLRWKEM